MESLRNWDYFLGLEFYRIPDSPTNQYIFLLVRRLYENQLIFHEETNNFTKIFWTTLLLNKHFEKELGEIYESKYMQM
jgi:hypothetical protein